MRKTYCKIENGIVVSQELWEEGATPDGETWLPVVVENPDYSRVTHREVRRENRIEVGRVVRVRIIEPIPVTPELIKAECQRRIIALTGATDLTHCMIKQSNANMRANELNDKRIRGEALSPQEEMEVAALRGLAETVKALRAKSNVIEAMSPVPIEFRDDRYWI